MAIKSSSELRAFMWGNMCGLCIFVGSLWFVAYIGDVRFIPMKGAEWRQMQADKHFGCDWKNTDLSTGECK